MSFNDAASLMAGGHVVGRHRAVAEVAISAVTELIEIHRSDPVPFMRSPVYRSVSAHPPSTKAADRRTGVTPADRVSRQADTHHFWP
jgi:hypothetical protein